MTFAVPTEREYAVGGFPEWWRAKQVLKYHAEYPGPYRWTIEPEGERLWVVGRFQLDPDPIHPEAIVV